MKREQLERFIVDAADGVLNDREIQKLETALQDHPDLYDDYKAIKKLPSLDHLYRFDSENERHQKSINRILDTLDKRKTSAVSFEEVTLQWFRRYALAASLAIFAITSLFSMLQSQNQTVSETTMEEYFYPAGESTADTYALYLDELTMEEDE
jgi:hypothetical protein